MNCQQCGNSLEAFHKFCPKCGATVPSPVYSAPQFPPTAVPQMAPQTSWNMPTSQPPADQKSGCGKVLLILAIVGGLLLVGLVGAGYYGFKSVENRIKKSDAYRVALEKLKESEAVKGVLGEIKSTGFPIGSYDENTDGTGKAAFTMSVEGTKTSGRYNVVMTRSLNIWRVQTGHVKTESGETVMVEGETPPDFTINNNEVPYDNSNNANQGTDNTGKKSKVISGGVLNGKAISLPPPTYPPVAKAAKAEGTVVVQVLVDEEGKVTTATAVSGHPLLRASAVAAARQARFTPTLLAGKPVKVSGTLSYKYTLE